MIRHIFQFTIKIQQSQQRTLNLLVEFWSLLEVSESVFYTSKWLILGTTQMSLEEVNLEDENKTALTNLQI